MTSNGLHNVGEEWAQKTIFRQDLVSRSASVSMLVYDDSSDSLTDSDDISAISTEPGGGQYNRASLQLDSSKFSVSQSSGNINIDVTGSFDLTGSSNSTGSVNAYGIVVSFKSTVVNSESSQNPHLLATGTFDEGARSVPTSTVTDVTATLSLN